MYDVETRRTESLSGKADLVFTSIIYEEQSSPEYTVENMSVYALVALTSYSYCGLFKTDLRLAVFMPNIVYAWKTFLPNRKTAELWVGSNPKLADNAVTCGYVKMDRLKEFVGRSAPERKKVIIAPHHSLGRGSDGLSISNFLRFSELFLSLPSLYPDIDFIFRPHPLLFTRLATDAWWGREKTEAYRAKMVSHPNVEFQQGGDYFETFAESTAMIHDCGSFLAEYFYLDKPQCYMADNGTERQLLPFGKELFDHAYRAGTERDIIDFIERVIIAGDDPMKKERAEFAAEAVCISYPHAATEITNEISRSFRPEGELL